MLSGWQAYGDESDMYYLGTEDQGFIHTGWVYTYAPEDAESDGEEVWYYLDGKGVPFNSRARDSYVGRDEKRWNYCQKMEDLDFGDIVQGVAARVINNKTYLFDKDGKMMTGFYYLQGVKRKGGASLGLIKIDETHFTGDFYYFNEDDGGAYGQMMIGSQTVEEGSGKKYKDCTFIVSPIKVFDNGIMRSEKKSKFPMYHDLLTCGPHL